MSDLDAFICDRCKEQTANPPAGYWTSLPFLVDSMGGRISLEFCAACAGEIQQAIGMPPRLLPQRRGLLARLLGGPG